MRKVKFNAFLISILSGIVLFNCELFENHEEYEVSLEVMDVFCIEAIFKVYLPDSGYVKSFNLVRDDSVVASFFTVDNDTVIIDSGLTPNTDYIYRVDFLKDGKVVSKSDELAIHTMDTTSHEVTWYIDTLGTAGWINDCWIVNENDIWVVGQIRLPDPDSSWNGTGYEDFNAAHWDGEKWEYLRAWGPVPLYSIWYFNENNVWVVGGFPIHWDGSKWTLYHLQDMGLGDDVSVDYIWASSPDDIYFVGYKGSIVHYDGKNFRKMESGTEISLTDIYGKDKNHIWACGEEMADMRSIILFCDGNKWTTIYERYLDGSNNLTNEQPGSPAAYTLWMSPNSSILWFDGGTDTYQMFQELPVTGYRDLDIFDYFSSLGFPERIRGNENNDVFIVGHHDAIHWNGVSWRRFDEIVNPLRLFKSVYVKGDFVVIVGWETQGLFCRGIVARGYRN